MSVAGRRPDRGERRGPRAATRTRFERNLFLGILVVALTLGAVSVASLAMTAQTLRTLFERLWSETGAQAVNRDLAFFARQYLGGLSQELAAALGRAAAECPAGRGGASLECVFRRLEGSGGVTAGLSMRCLRLYHGRSGAWELAAERCAGAALADSAALSPGAGGEWEVADEALDRFDRSGAQPEQRRIGVIQSFRSWPGAAAGESFVLVAFASADSALDERWRRSVANVDRPSFAPFIAALVWRQSAWLLAGVALVTVLSVVVSRLLSARVSRPLAGLVAAMGEVARGNLSHRAPPVSQAEFGFLTDSFNSMTENIERLNRETREAARIRRELEMAREIQLKLFPQRLPRIEGYDLFASNVPSLEVSGDYYDALPWGNQGALALALADVSGKGVPAALLMSNLQACLHGQAMRPPEEPGVWMAGINRQLLETTESRRFVTFFLSVLEPRQNRLVYVNGGHNHPLLLRRDGRIEELTEGGPVVGVLPDAEYDSAEVRLDGGDVLLIYSDGVTEAASSSMAEFGEERLARLLLEARDLTAERIGSGIFEEVRRHTGLESQADDMTVMVLKVLPAAGA